MKKINLILFALTVVFAGVITNACFSTKTATAPPEKISANFNYTPPVEGIVKRNDVSFILLNPKFTNDLMKPFVNTDPWRTFSGNMGNDFKEMLTQRGFPFQGPYENYDELVYNQKKNTDLILEVDIDLLGKQTGLQNRYNTYTKITEYWIDGSATIEGKVNLYLSEPFTKTRVWVKSIPIPTQTFYAKSTHRYKTSTVPMEDPGLWNAWVAELDKTYSKIMQTAWNHLDPEEMLVKKKEADEIKANSGFMKN